MISGLATIGLLAGATLPAPAVTLGTATNVSATLRAARYVGREVPRGALALRDLGRQRPLARVSSTVTLRYNHQSELDALVLNQSDPRSPLYHHFLTSAQFASYFAPTVQQQAFVVSALQAAGLRVTHSYPNRTLLDLQGTNEAAERLFRTEIHSLVQGRFGTRFANVTAPVIPASLAPFVRSVSLSNVIVAHTGPRVVSRSVAGLASAEAVARAALGQRTPPNRQPPSLQQFVLPANQQPSAGDAVADSGFESGAFGHGWAPCESAQAAPLATVTSADAYAGRYSGRAGLKNQFSGAERGYAGVCQLVTVPANGVLSASLYQLSNEPNATYAAQDVLLLDTSGHVAATLAQTVTNQPVWTAHSWNLANYAGRVLYVYFGVHGDGYRGTYTEQLVDNVSLVNASATPPPSPQPTAMPTPGCTASAENGPLHNGSGYLATGVAKAFDYPVQHGCNGAGMTVAVEISSPVHQSDIDAYMNAAGVSRHGTIANVSINGGGVYGGSSSDDTVEASLDVETIAGLAPGANVRVYNVPDLSDQHIEDAYNQTVSDNIASVSNSSFGGCERQDPSFSNATNAIAEQGAAEGMTFVASSGDSGSDECSTNNNPPGPSGPAGDPYFVSVGGVNFTQDSSGTLASIGAQGDVSGSGFLSGGGVSTLFALPSYQSGIANTLTSGRNSPDVSLPGVDVAIYVGGTIIAADGTSWSAPCLAALLAEASQLNDFTRFGFLNPALYNLFRSRNYADFTDVTAGNNGAYAASSGYDRVTGIGAPKGYAFASAL